MGFYIAVVLCCVLGAVLALKAILLAIDAYRIMRILYLFSVVSYKAAMPNGMFAHWRFCGALMDAYPKLLALCKVGTDGGNHEQKL
jgi:hypothetical protein